MYTCNNHDSHYPVGCASVVVAQDLAEARELLDKQLISCGLRPYKNKPYDLIKVCLEAPAATILCDGNY